MTGKEMPSSSKKPPRSTFSRIVWIAFIVAFIVVFALVAMAWLTMQKSDSVRSPGDASAPQQGVEIWQPNGASAVSGQTYSPPSAADMNAASQASEPEERPNPRRAAPTTPAEEEVPIQPIAPQQETEIRPIEVPVKPAPQPQPRQSGGDGGGNPVDSLF